MRSALTEAEAKAPAKSSACSRCGLRDRALCAAFPNHALPELEAIRTEHDLPAHAPLYEEGEPAVELLAVTAGAVKLYKLLEDGRQQGLGFRFAGSLLGFEAGEVHGHSAETILPTRICRFPRRPMDQLRVKIPSLNQRLLELAGEELAEAQRQIVLLGRRSAEERVASLLFDLQARQAALGRSASSIDLPMSRAEIGEYLGLTVETVSRTFTSLRVAKVIGLARPTHVTVLDQRRLAHLAETD